MLASSFVAALLSTVGLSADESARRFDAPAGPAAEADRLLREALDSTEKSSAAEKTARLREAIQAARERLTPQGLVAERLASALGDAAEASPEQASGALEQAARKAHQALAFEPVGEAALPRGFPTYTRVGTIEVKQYPAYRMAVGKGFWTLFRHIQRNDIAMTAPVQMDYEKKSGELAEKSMAFLYGRPDLGKTGDAGRVSVVDVPAATVVSTGVRGRRTDERVADARRRLEAWLAASSKYRAVAPMRIMAYNSPFVPADKQYLEVQIPVQAIAPREPGDSDPAPDARPPSP